jgi:hypothetical protein
MTETETTKTSRLPKKFPQYFGKRNAQPLKRSRLWDPDPAAPLTSQPRRHTTSVVGAPLIYGTAAQREIRWGIVAACLMFGAVIQDWKPPASALMVVIPALAALFWDNKRWIFGQRALQIEYSNALRTKAVSVRPGDFLGVGSRIIKGSGAETYEVMITVRPGRSHTKTYPTEHEADILKQQVLKTLGPIDTD